MIHPHDLAKDLHSLVESFLLLDCRPILAYNSCHITGMVVLCMCLCLCSQLAMTACTSCGVLVLVLVGCHFVLKSRREKQHVGSSRDLTRAAAHMSLRCSRELVLDSN